jgi:hypothetical protein
LTPASTIFSLLYICIAMYALPDYLFVSDHYHFSFYRIYISEKKKKSRTMRTRRKNFVWVIVLLFIPLIQSYDLMDITNSVFGNFSAVIPAAFGDFNGDKLTDMFVLKVDTEPPYVVGTVIVLVAQEQKVVGSASSLTPLFQWGTLQQKLRCRIDKVGG